VTRNEKFEHGTVLKKDGEENRDEEDRISAKKDAGAQTSS